MAVTVLHISSTNTPLAVSPGRGGGVTYHWHVTRNGRLFETGLREFYVRSQAEEDGIEWAKQAHIAIDSISHEHGH